MNDTESKLRQTVKELFEGERIDVIVGHTNGSLPLRSRPCFVSGAEGLEKLVWNSYCLNNLAVYLPRFFEVQAHRKKEEVPSPKVGIVVKGCDMRSVVGLIKEKQAPRENVVIVGIPCKGMIDPAKVTDVLSGESVSEAEEKSDDTLLVTTRQGETKSIKKDQVMAEACQECRYPVPEGADVLVEGEAKDIAEQTYRRVIDFEALSAEERWKYFADELSRCIRCYACRHVCPNCYCKVCFADQTMPRWIGAGTEASDVMLYHIGRIFHQAGRCVECDACVRACPMDIDLRTFTQMLEKDVKELFNYTPGLSFEELPPLCTYKEDDSQSFITEP